MNHQSRPKRYGRQMIYHHFLVVSFVVVVIITSSLCETCDAFATQRYHHRVGGIRRKPYQLDGTTTTRRRRTSRSFSQEYVTVTRVSRTSVHSTYDDNSYDDEDVVDDANIDFLDDIDDDDVEHDEKDDVQYIRYRCRVSYNGATYNGFQYQPTARTIQGELEAAFSRRFNVPVVRVVGAGRTDAGVHARGQAIHFDLKHTITKSNNSSSSNNNIYNGYYNETELQQIEDSINRMLHDSLRIWNLCVAPRPSIEYVNGKQGLYRWNVMRKPHGKLYSYRFSTSPCMDPIERHTRWQLDLSSKLRRDTYDNNCNNNDEDNTSDNRRSVLDLQYLQTLLRYYEGTHDFGCFAGAVEQQQKKKNAAKKKKNKNTKQGQDEKQPDNINIDDSSSSRRRSIEETLPPSIVDTIRTVYSVTLVDEGNDNYRIDVALEGALYKMVRNMVGTAIDVCLGRQNLTEEQFKVMLGLPIRDNDEDDDENEGDGGDGVQKEKNKTTTTKFALTRNNNPCKPAPPQGLTLEWVYYDEEDAKIF